MSRSIKKGPFVDRKLLVKVINQKNTRYDSQTVHGTNASSQRTWTSRFQSAKRDANGTLADLP